MRGQSDNGEFTATLEKIVDSEGVDEAYLTETFKRLGYFNYARDLNEDMTCYILNGTNNYTINGLLDLSSSKHPSLPQNAHAHPQTQQTQNTNMAPPHIIVKMPPVIIPDILFNEPTIVIIKPHRNIKHDDINQTYFIIV